MNKTHPFFSVILPVYNGADTLDTAIVSILAQTYPDFELLIIENASTDNSLNIARAYEKSFDKVRVFHLDEALQPKARNFGLDNARGEYIVFVDADDLYRADALERMHAVLENEKADVLIAGFTNYPLLESDRIIHARGRDLHLALLDPVTYYPGIVDNFAENDFLLRHQCSRAYRRDPIEKAGVRFNENSPIYVDLIFNSAVYASCENAVLIYKRLYQYNKVRGSLINRAGSAFVLDSIAAFNVITEGIDKLDCETMNAVLFSAFLMITRMISAYTKSPDSKCFELLDDFCQSAGARRVIEGVRSDRLHLLPEDDALYCRVLDKLRRNDIFAAAQIISSARRASDRGANKCMNRA